MVRHIGKKGRIDRMLAAICKAAAPCAVIAVISLSLPVEAIAWGERAHQKIAESALDALPADLNRQVLLYKEDLFNGISSGIKHAPNPENELSAEIQLLMLIPHREDELSRYFTYRLGELSVVVSDTALPFSDTSNKKVWERLEADIDDDVSSYRAYNTKTTNLTYPVLYLERLKAEAQKSENFVKTRYLTGQGYLTCREDLLLPAFRNAVEGVASLWKTILTKDPDPGALSPPIRMMYYTSQIKFACEHNYLDDVEMALQELKEENRRIPLTPSFVGDAFFKLPHSSQAKGIYELASAVDPQSTAISSCLQECREHPEEEPEIDQSATRRRKLAQYLYGKDGKPPIYVYEHASGLKLFTSKVKDLGPDYVLLNFEPVKKITKKKVVRKVKNEPQVEEYDLEEIIREYAKEYDLSPALVKAVIKAESNFDPFAVSGCGARGLMQLMPMTAMDMEVTDSFDPEQNVGGGVQYLARMLELFDNNLELALAAYNAGPGSVLKYGGVPPFKETRKYVPKVLAYYEKYKKDSSPVTLKVALNKKPAADFLPEVEVVEEVEEVTVVASPPVPKPAPDMVVVHLKNGQTVRGSSYEKTATGIRLILPNGWADISNEKITKIS
jgi:hypothetical protein